MPGRRREVPSADLGAGLTLSGARACRGPRRVSGVPRPRNSDESEKGGDDMEITVVKVERIEATLKHVTEYEAA